MTAVIRRLDGYVLTDISQFPNLVIYSRQLGLFTTLLGRDQPR